MRGAERRGKEMTVSRGEVRIREERGGEEG
jgi:hypothetical protein